MSDVWRTIQQFAADYGGRILAAVLILAVGWAMIRFLIGPLRRLMERSHCDPSVTSFLVNSARTIMVLAVLLGVLNQLGVETASLLTLLGAVALAVALSLQGSLANYASGLVVLSFRIVRVGDVIETGGICGRVVELLPFHAVLVTADNQRVTVPNTILTTAAVRNHTALSSRRVEWTLPVPAAIDLAAAKAALRARLVADARILTEPAPQIYVKEWLDDKRMMTVTAWADTQHYTAVQQELLESLGLGLDEVRRTGNPGPA
jgi:small conductance mechanosensitive channel